MDTFAHPILKHATYSFQVLTIAILAIVLTAPAGAIATSLLGRLLLKKSDEEEQADTERKG